VRRHQRHEIGCYELIDTEAGSQDPVLGVPGRRLALSMRHMPE
jgi:hypothetical protein